MNKYEQELIKKRMNVVPEMKMRTKVIIFHPTTLATAYVRDLQLYL